MDLLVCWLADFERKKRERLRTSGSFYFQSEFIFLSSSPRSAQCWWYLMEKCLLFKAKYWVMSCYGRRRLWRWSCSVMWRLLIGCYRHSDWRITADPAARCYPSGNTWTVCICWSAPPKTGAAPNTRRDFLLLSPWTLFPCPEYVFVSSAAEGEHWEVLHLVCGRRQSHGSTEGACDRHLPE